MASSEFDQHFRDQMENHEGFSIPEDLSWDNISVELLDKLQKEKKKRRKVLFWWWFGAGSLVALILLGVFLNFPKKPSNSLPDFAQETIKSQQFNSVKTPTTQTFNGLEQVPPGFPKETDLLPKKLAPNTLLKAPSNISSQSLFVLSFDSGVVKRPLSIKPGNNLDSESPEVFPALGILSVPIPNLDWQEEKRANSTNIPVSFSKNESWSIQLFGGINQFSSEYQTSLETTDALFPFEKNLLGWQAGLRLQRQWNKRFYLLSGIEIEQLKYQFDYQSSVDVQLYRPNTVDTIFVNPFLADSTFSYIDSIPGTRTRQIRHFNQYASLNIPILAGYQIVQGNFILGLQAGVSLQFFRSAEGKTSANFPDLINIEQNQLYRSGLNIGLSMEAQLSYPITQKLHVFGLIGLNKMLGNRLSNDFRDFSQRPLVYRFNVGVMHRF